MKRELTIDVLSVCVGMVLTACTHAATGGGTVSENKVEIPDRSTVPVVRAALGDTYENVVAKSESSDSLEIIDRKPMQTIVEGVHQFVYEHGENSIAFPVSKLTLLNYTGEGRFGPGPPHIGFIDVGFGVGYISGDDVYDVIEHMVALVDDAGWKPDCRYPTWEERKSSIREDFEARGPKGASRHMFQAWSKDDVSISGWVFLRHRIDDPSSKAWGFTENKYVVRLEIADDSDRIRFKDECVNE